MFLNSPFIFLLLATFTLALPINLGITPGWEPEAQGEFPQCFLCVREWGSGAYIAGLLAAFETVFTGHPAPVALPNRNEQLPLPPHRRDTTSSSTPSLSKGAIAGIAVGSFFAILILASLAYLAHRRLARFSPASEESPRSGKGPRRTTSSLDFRCRTRVTPMASRADFRRLDSPQPEEAVKKGGGDAKRMSGVGPGDALGSNPVLADTLDEDPAVSPLASDGVSWDGPTLCSPGYSPPYTNSAKWASPSITATISSPQVPTPAYSSNRVSPHAAAATPLSTQPSAPLLPAKPAYIPAKYGSVSPFGHYSVMVGYRPLYTLDEMQGVPERALRTRDGEWDLHARSRALERGSGRLVSTEGARVEEAAEMGIIPVGLRASGLK